ncbi:adenylosuccinate synthase [Polynucleobacter sp. Fuers-14]|uniref:adenylosuccinate synthase n=1 Tax=Polynucleobacter sp. Fuers-14 TaxID=1758364 RepID=UPI001C0CA795|nr:adenylosuccinate synthase [Polynucleobacter sp. Fuers-14]MBU3640965.1 adenylosuccinate synthase [Polynucleobacter sp. Fuers-14]
MNHGELCAVAVAWLQRPASRTGPGCTVAISETANWINSEIPDAIGWRPYIHSHGGSVVVEVKTSRADFLADRRKPHRIDGAIGMGTYRYFLAPEGIIQTGELPLKWGLVEINTRGHLKVRAGHLLRDLQKEDVWRHDHNQYAEICTLAMTLNRIGNPQKFQNQMREMSSQVSKLAKRNDDLIKRNRDLSREINLLRSEGCECGPTRTGSTYCGEGVLQDILRGN